MTTTIAAQMVKELRDKTGVGMMDCKKALVEADGDMDLAFDYLRKAGIAKAEKKAGRTAREGRVASYLAEGVGALVEVLCETDFVAKNEGFQAFTSSLAQRVAQSYSTDGDVAAEVAAEEKASIGELVGVLGENMQIRRALRWTTDGALTCYLHMGGRIGVLLDSTGESSADLLNDVCMHIAAFSPRYIGPDDVPPDVIAKEKEIAAAQVAGKPANIMDKIVMGKINKWYTETCLTRQPWIRDDKTTLAKVAPQLEIRRFVRWQVGEEI